MKNGKSIHLFLILRGFAAVLFSALVLSACKKADFNQQQTSAGLPSMAAAARPNIIFILGDDVGYEVPTVNGGESYSTPNIDQMAANGMRFTQAHASALCSPSRFMMLTGKYNFRNYTVWGVMDTSNRTIANMLKDQGYRTCVSGKWQLDGGENSIYKFGFDEYMIYNPYAYDGEGKGSRYKDPSIYQGGRVIPRRQTDGLYGDDLFANFVGDFIDRNKTNPFFIYYSMANTHEPFSPTPLDPEFEAWDARAGISDPVFYPSMAHYMDVKIGQVIQKVQSAGLANKTVIIYSGDNGTSSKITSRFKGQDFVGGKTYTTEAGTHVPLIVLWPGKITPGSVNNDLVDFTDIMPTVADLARVPLPTNYGILDGVSFYPALAGPSPSPRPWIFNHYEPEVKGGASNTLKRFVQDSVYKLYEKGEKFFNIKLDPKELAPIRTSQMTQQEKAIKQNFKNVLAVMHD